MRTGLGQRNDLSYGAYLYAFPLQQLMSVVGVDRLSILLHLVLSLALTLLAAFLSWHLVERPAQQLGKRLISALRMPRPPRGSTA
ncbi:hypothetical protein JSY14_05935 [Brachybacterium sp. EF45031]|uniref:hypothetical protein n=1 Tax=Brachybacterium sillae TaxID=2810536 RepID=UPI00217E1E50|nr:hypothetical protein [Brachybacterium sillae]MCS6711587.1 hypothetical protein [Brachybacterium sillae]